MKALSPILLYLSVAIYANSSSKTSHVQTQTSPTVAKTATPNTNLSPLNTDNIYFVAHPHYNASNSIPTVGVWKPVDLTNPLHMKRQNSCPAGAKAAVASSGSGRSMSAGNVNWGFWSILGEMLVSLLGEVVIGFIHKFISGYTTVPKYGRCYISLVRLKRL